MKVLRLVTLAVLVIGLPLPLAAQQLERDVTAVSDVEGRLEGFSFQEGPVSTLEFHGTAIALAAEGEGKVEFQEGRARVDISVRKLPDPWKLGPFSTYVLWAVTADGRANNLGSLELREGRGSLKATTSLSQFGLIVSAEPHFSVTAPSKYLVLRNLGRRIRGQSMMIAGLTERIDYAGLAAQPFDPGSKVPLDLVQARYALAIARGAQADKFATDEFGQAEQLLVNAEAAQASKKYKIRNTVPLLARDAVQMGEDARRKAVLGRQAAEVAAEAAASAAREEAAAVAARQTAEEKARLAANIALEEAKRREMQTAEQAARDAALEANRLARADLTARLNRALPTRQTERGIVAEIAGVQFAIGAATLNTDAREALARFAGIVGVYPSLRFKVEGHTDNTGSYETNQTLSFARAISVQDYLIGQGVDASSIETEGLGPDQPIAGNETREGRARNRRVEIILTGDLVTAH
ncbi:MAG: OmpA/MotB domain protein [Steroidobacteraceae bacterium]|nr:OmpA/MotB domain protein [Steroidobacteraceae bacterium]